MTESNLQKITKAIALVKEYPNEIIEATVVKYVVDQTKKEFYYSEELLALKKNIDQELLFRFHEIEFPTEIEFLIEFFEALLEKDNVAENGIVFTPKYIADYINNCVLEGMNKYSVAHKIIDPGCGCGIFLVSAAEAMKNKYGVSLTEILNSNIYGIDIDEDNVRRCKIILNLFAVLNGESNKNLKLNITCEDSLKCRWNELFFVSGFDGIIGNPPYVNTHDMSKDTAKFLKQSFKTTKTGVFNIFYAFIEHAMEFLNDRGKLSYIVPNNFLTIKSAIDLRELLAKNRWIEKIIDFSENMVFKPIRTYNCIIQLSRDNKDMFHYCVMEKADDISLKLSKLEFNQMNTDRLDVNGWNLVDKTTMSNISKIEGQFRSIKDFVRTGIATLRDNIYMVEYDGVDYYKVVDEMKYIIEPTLIKRLYKISDLKQNEDIKEGCRHIIFPYQKGKGGFEIIPEEKLKKETPKTYQYLCMQRKELDKRDKGKQNTVAWYAYGRTQGLNKYGIKLVFPTFASKPKFTLIDDEFALFCNGYALFENDYIELEVLRKILNSVVMQYYIKNTSYAIEGGYYCYQKKYIEKFSLPYFKEEEKKKLLQMTESELDRYLIERYHLDL